MKKLVMTAAVLALAVSFASAVTSSNIVGYAKVVKPANGNLNMVGVSFVSQTTQTLNELFPADQFEGDLFDPNLSDQLIAWNSGTQAYATYVYYDVSGTYGPAYASYDGWQEIGQFGSANYANPTLPAGSAFWFKGSGGSPSTFMAQGEVKTEASVVSPIVVGLQQVANPYATANTIGGLFGNQASGDLFNASASDQIIMWNADTQSYTTYVYYDVSGTYGPGYASYDGWQEYGQFGSAIYADNTVVPVGQGFWYKAVSGFSWTANRNFTP
jgi:hypothetical protein